MGHDPTHVPNLACVLVQFHLFLLWRYLILGIGEVILWRIQSASARERTCCHPTSDMEWNMVAGRVPTTLACELDDDVKPPSAFRSRFAVGHNSVSTLYSLDFGRWVDSCSPRHTLVSTIQQF